MKPFRVLSLDGGGMRALYSLSVLKTLIKNFNSSSNKDIGKQFDLIVGTSTGAIIGSSLAYGKSLNDIHLLYKAWGKHIFAHPMKVKKSLVLKLDGLKNLWSAANRNKILKQTLKEAFRDETLEELYTRRGIGLCVNSIYMQSHDPKVFKTPHSPTYQVDNKRKLTDICLASSAAPFFFPLALIKNPSSQEIEAYCDGGVWSGNPIFVALTEALYIAQKTQAIEIVSIGVGPSPYEKTFTEKSANRGFLGWGLGSRLSELSVDIQGKSFALVAQALAQKFSELGQSVKIIRAEMSLPEPEEVNHLGVDVSTPAAFQTWEKLGEKDGLKTCKKIKEGSSSLAPLKDIFSDLDDF